MSAMLLALIVGSWQCATVNPLTVLPVLYLAFAAYGFGVWGLRFSEETISIIDFVAVSDQLLG